MKKLLSISLIPVLAIFLFGAFFAMPADAQTAPTEGCTLVKNVEIDIKVNGTTADEEDILIIHEDAVVSADKSKVTGNVTHKNISPAVPSKEAVTTEQKEKIAEKWGTICLLNTVNTIVDWVFIFLLAVAVALIAIAGFMWMTGGAKPESQKMAGQMIMAAVIGIVIALLARLIPALVTGIL